jgi:hypothetical protein
MSTSKAPNYLLYEHAIGYTLLKIKEHEDSGQIVTEVCIKNVIGFVPLGLLKNICLSIKSQFVRNLHDNRNIKVCRSNMQ